MTRRGLLQSLAAAIWAAWQGRGLGAELSSKDVEEVQRNWKALLAEGVKVALPSEPFKLSKDEWRKRLDAMQFSVLREEDTERPGSSPLNSEKRPGVFLCTGWV